MSTQGVRIMKPVEDEFLPASESLQKKNPDSRPVIFLSILLSLISTAFAVIVFTQAQL